MTQEEIWQNHVKHLNVEDVMRQYNAPAVFQQELTELIESYAAGKDECRTIELGCELGVTSLLLNDAFNKTLLDLNPLAIDLTKKAHQKLDKHATFIVADMFETPFEDETFDIVFNAGVIEHFNQSDRTKALQEYARILKKDGIMIVAFPNHYSLPYRMAYMIRTLLRKWPYPSEYKLFDLCDEIRASNMHLQERRTLSKKTLFRWLNFSPPLKYIMEAVDRLKPFEGYLTVLLIRKKH